MVDLKWWQKAVFYQIYPRSFADGNGDGIGDFPGMLSKLDYLRALGIDAVWLSPHYPSPFLDCGYDISDYTGVGPEYGTLDDFKHFLEAAHQRDIKVILDFVLNHTSDLHAWFKESRSSLDNPKRDWYIWRDSKDGGPPNNWQSLFGGSAWELDPQTGQYYYHCFLKEQPDLNWRNPVVKKAMWDVVRFWLDLGVDGFRLDAIATIYEHTGLPNHSLPPEKLRNNSAHGLTKNEFDQLMRYQLHQPGVHELMQELRALVDEYPGDKVLVGEDDNVAYHGTGDNELHLVFNFPLMLAHRLTPEHIRSNQAIRLADLPPGAWPCNTLGNHDTPRMWSRYGDGKHDAELARLHLALLLTLKGTPFLYNGEEIGMTNLKLTAYDQLRDMMAVNIYGKEINEGVSQEAALAKALRITRDRCRSPLQWDTSANSGFSPAGVETWLPVNANYLEGVNVAEQLNDPASLLNFYRELLALRRGIPALIAGEYLALNPQSEEYLAFLRTDTATGQTCLVVLNFSDTKQAAIFDLEKSQARLLYSNRARQEDALDLGQVDLQPFEILVAELDPAH